MTRIALAPCSPFSVTPGLMESTRALARTHGVLCHTHLAETADEQAFCMERFGCRALEYAERLGWTGPDVWFAHCVDMAGAEIGRLAASDSGVAHCPSSNMRLGSGIAPIAEMLNARVRVGLAVDGSASNDSSHLLAEARQAMLLQRVRGGATAMTARKALEMATLGGSAVLGRDDIGALVPGKAADIVGFSVTGIDQAGGLHDPVAALLFCTPPKAAMSVINGRVLVRDGAAVGVDIADTVRRHNAIAAEMMRLAASR